MGLLVQESQALGCATAMCNGGVCTQPLGACYPSRDMQSQSVHLISQVAKILDFWNSYNSHVYIYPKPTTEHKDDSHFVFRWEPGLEKKIVPPLEPPQLRAVGSRSPKSRGLGVRDDM